MSDGRAARSGAAEAPALAAPTAATAEAALVLRADRWADNGALIAGPVVALGYLRAEWRTLDPTYGQGVWWRRWRPDVLVVHCRDVDGTDFRCLPYEDGTFEAVAWDPPYCCRGGRETATTFSAGDGSINARFGLVDAPATPAALRALIRDGLAEQHRLLCAGGHLLVKCMDYVSSGRVQMGTAWAWEDATALGLVVEDYFDLVTDPRPQPPRSRGGEPSRQRRARANTSRLWVFRKPGRRPRRLPDLAATHERNEVP